MATINWVGSFVPELFPGRMTQHIIIPGRNFISGINSFQSSSGLFRTVRRSKTVRCNAWATLHVSFMQSARLLATEINTQWHRTEVPCHVIFAGLMIMCELVKWLQFYLKMLHCMRDTLCFSLVRHSATSRKVTDLIPEWDHFGFLN